jgi:NHLM bacteriocin system ABC transporter ATP-binding protein
MVEQQQKEIAGLETPAQTEQSCSSGTDGSVERNQDRLSLKLEADRRLVDGALHRFTTLLDDNADSIEIEADEPLLDVCRHVAKPLGLSIVKPLNDLNTGKGEITLNSIIRASHLRSRQVALRDQWWTQDNGPMVAFMGEDKRPVALLQKNASTYQLYDPAAHGILTPVTAAVAAELNPFAHVIYRTLPSRSLNGMDLLRFALKGRGGDMALILLAGFAAGLLGLLTPIATGIIFDTIIPGAQLNQLFMLTIALLVSSVSVAIFNFTRSITILRVEGRMDQHVQGAIWDRVLELPVPFFRQFSAGDLADRAMGIDTIRRIVSGSVCNTILSGIFSFLTLGLLFWYSTKLAKVALLLTLFVLVFMSITSVIQLRYQKELAGIGGKIAGLVLENITGIATFRVSGTEDRVFARWAKMFASQRRLTIKARIVQNTVETFSSVYPVVTTMIIFMMIIWFPDKEQKLSIGEFLAFNAAFSQFMLSVLGVFGSVVSTIATLPLYQRCRPILETQPESDEAKDHPGQLTGDVEVNHLSFRYNLDSPLILDDVSLRVHSGDFIALVGSSGSGKSTLLRLLLGFEKYKSGGIFYDDQDLTGLDVRELRRQIGVVLQNGQLLAGNIFSNIVGSAPLTVDDAWDAARSAGLAEDIELMPMGMFTMISQGGGGLSGGQRQRVLIARALAAKPKILFFDEATSALDNKTQAVVNCSLEKLQITRIVIAHRLSTIINADKIYVLDQGRIVQHGSYNDLMAQPGLFAKLAKRQLA